MFRWIVEARRWIVIGLIVVGMIFVLRGFCRCSRSSSPSHQELIEEAVGEGWGVDQESALVSEREIEKATDLPAEHIESTTTAEFEQPVTEVDVVVTDEGDVLVTGKTEVGERLPPKRIKTLKKKPAPEPWVKKDFGLGLGVCWDFDKTVEPCLRIQTLRWFGSVTAPDPVVSLKYAGVSVNFPLKLWVLRNTSVGGMLKWDYDGLSTAPDVAVVISVQL